MKNIIPLKRKKIIITIGCMVIAFASFISLSFTFTKEPSKIWSQLGISERTGVENIRKSFLEGYLYTYGASAAKKVATGDRVAVVKDLLLYCKEYVHGSSFKNEYDIARAASKPIKPQSPKTKEQIQRERIDDLNKSILEMEKTMKTLPADLIKSFDEGLQMLKDQVKDFENPESEMLAIMVDGEAYNCKAACQQYETNMAAWEKEFPADHLQMVKARLEMFLNTTADVDFNAVLKEEYHVQKFVNPAYERKPAEWKMAFRSGKPVVETARSFAKQWLTELN